jgi:citrate lyase subunit beta/citryl-CoA lyase
MGTNDLLKESRARALHNRIAVVPWLAMTIVAARAYGLDVLDGVYNDFRDEAGFREECLRASTLGCMGKWAIHPSQIAIAKEVFSPDPAKVADARKLVEAYAAAEAEGLGAIKFEGAMIDVATVRLLRHGILARAELYGM